MLKRRFDQTLPYRAFGTDITYLYDGSGHRSYLSILKDLASGEIVAHRLSASLGVDLSLDIIGQLATKIGRKPLKGAFIHSDQGFHYTHPVYSKRLIDLSIVQSMSRKGNCLDNAPAESFFGHLKDELDLTDCHSLDQVRATWTTTSTTTTTTATNGKEKRWPLWSTGTTFWPDRRGVF